MCRSTVFIQALVQNRLQSCNISGAKTFEVILVISGGRLDEATAELGRQAVRHLVVTRGWWGTAVASYSSIAPWWTEMYHSMSM